MIKRGGAFLLALLYTITVAGFALNLHYCGNTIADVQINAPAKACAKPMVMAKSKMNCCKDSKITVKIKDDHQQESTSFLAHPFAFDLPKFKIADFLLAAQLALLEKIFDRGPPDIPSESICVFLKNCVFRI